MGSGPCSVSNQLPKQYKALLVRIYKRWSTGAGVAKTSSSMSFTARISQMGPSLDYRDVAALAGGVDFAVGCYRRGVEEFERARDPALFQD